MAQRFSENGWPAYPNASRFARGTAHLKDGSELAFIAANEDWVTVFAEYIERYDREVEPVGGPVRDDWSYANRLVRGSATVVSNHGSATAIDLNALQHPLSTRTLTAAKLAAMRKIKDDITDDSGRPVLRLGADYSGRPDEMHVEGAPGTTAKQVAQAAAKIREGKDMDFTAKHKLTQSDVDAYDNPKLKVGMEKSYDELVRFPPATARLRREVADLKQDVKDLRALVARLLPPETK